LINLLFSDRRPQVHITLGDEEGTSMIVSWVTANELGSSTVMYSEASPDPEKMELCVEGTHTRYDYFNYTSGFIHHCTLKNLKVSWLVCQLVAKIDTRIHPILHSPGGLSICYAFSSFFQNQ